jgi:hypothetical protein
MKKVLVVFLMIFGVCGCIDTDIPLVQELDEENQAGVLVMTPINLFGGIGIARVKTFDNRIVTVYFNVECDELKKGDNVTVQAKLINGNRVTLFGRKNQNVNHQ